MLAPAILSQLEAAVGSAHVRTDVASLQTYGTDALIVRASNNYGPRQHPEKLIPLCILNALAGDPLPVYGDGQQVRNWLWVEDFARAYGYDLRDWAGYKTLMEIRDLLKERRA